MTIISAGSQPTSTQQTLTSRS